MLKRIVALVFIFVMTAVAWTILGGVTDIRSRTQDNKLRDAVGQLWGKIQKQRAPHVYYMIWREKTIEKEVDGKTVTEKEMVKTDYQVIIERTDINVGLSLEHRRKGLLWYSAYRLIFSGAYLIENSGDSRREYYFEYTFPNKDGIYDDFVLSIDGQAVESLYPTKGRITRKFSLEPGDSTLIEIGYGSQGMDEWWYTFGETVAQIKNFKLTMETDFGDVNFPENSIAPVRKEKIDGGWRLLWEYSNLVSGIQIGMEMPKKLNPGPFVSRVSYFAPVSLFLFMFLVFVVSMVKKINIHPMNYFFIAAAFFSFHLLLAYLVDHMALYPSLLICSAVSIILVISYMRLVVGVRFAYLEIGVSQFVYLVLFSYAFLLEGFTGLAITICCILTLFLVMQYTARLDWGAQFDGNRPPSG
jgi:inner membrane protein involved in colicin E2 resistance